MYLSLFINLTDFVYKGDKYPGDEEIALAKPDAIRLPIALSSFIHLPLDILYRVHQS
jgi:hypothetical protein